MRRALPWLSGAALVLVAGAVTVSSPTEHALLDPFLIRGGVSEPATSRTLVVQMRAASFADEVTVEESDWSAEGNWLVVTLAASAPRTEVDAAIILATLVVDGRTFQASERLETSLVDTDLHVGADTVGGLAFELPADLDAGAAELRLTPAYSTPELDDVIAIPLVLDEVPRAASIDVGPPMLGAP